MKIINLLEGILNEMPLELDMEQRKEWMEIQMSLFNKIALREKWTKNSPEYLKALFLFGKIFADKYDGNFNKIHSISNESKKEMNKALIMSLKERLVR